MNSPKITFVVNGNTYSIQADDTQALASIKAADQTALIALLESLKQHKSAQDHRAATRLAQASAAASSINSINNTSSSNSAPSGPGKTERLGRGDADALMARLIMEEKAKQKQLPSHRSFYKWILGIGIVVILWVLLF